MKKKYLANIATGEIFDFAGEQFVVLEHRGNETLVLLARSIGSCPFNNHSRPEEANNYKHSTLKKRIDKWIRSLPRDSEEAAAIHEFEVDLNCTDRSGGYGTTTVRAAPLTLWQYGQFRELIPLKDDDRFWLVTPWMRWWISYPYTGSAHLAWVVCGDCGYEDCIVLDSCGIRPALTLASETLVSCYGDDDAECSGDREDCGDGKSEDISSDRTADLMTEMQNGGERP